MFRLTSLALIGVAAGGVFAMRLLGQTTAGQSWWVEGGLGFLVLATLLAQWTMAVKQNAADRVAHDALVAAMNLAHAKHISDILQEKQQEVNTAIAAKAASDAALLAEIKEQCDEHKKRIDELERTNKGSDHGGRKIVQIENQ